MATEASRAIEAILMVAQEPVDPHLLAQVLEVSPVRVAELCDELAAAYASDDRGFVLVKVAGGYRFQSHEDLAAYVERFVLEGQSARLSSAALETLAIVAYKQPISRAQVSAIRGVNVDGVMRTLVQRGYVAEIARDPGPGQATLFGTTDEFLERLGLAGIEDLPSVADLFPPADLLEALDLGFRPDRPATGGTDEPEADRSTVNPPFDAIPVPTGPEPDRTFPLAEDPDQADRSDLDDLGEQDEIAVPSWFTETPAEADDEPEPPGPSEEGGPAPDRPVDPPADPEPPSGPS